MNNVIFYFFNNLAYQSRIIDNLIIFLGVYFPFIVIALAVIFLFFYHKKSPKEVFIVFFSSSLAWVIAKILKVLVHSDRPFIALKNTNLLFRDDSFAFPSGHATFFMALAVALFFHHKKTGYLFMLFAVIIGIARIAGGVHFPIDILGGIVLGATVAYFVKNV